MRSASSPASTRHPGEDALKAFGAAAASSGAVGLFHIAGVTPEAPDLATALGGQRRRDRDRGDAGDGRRRAHAAVDGRGQQPRSTRWRSAARICRSPSSTSSSGCWPGGGSPCRSTPAPAATWSPRSIATGGASRLEGLGVVVVADTCVVVTPILPDLPDGVLMTNSGKFAHYAPGNTGYAVLYGSLADCVESAVAGRPVVGELAA